MKDDIDQEVKVSWSSITSELKKSLDKDTFQNWIKPIQFESLLDTSLTLSVPTRFLRDWIIKNYAPVIKRAYLDQDITINKLSILVKENNNRVIPGTEVVHQEKEEDGDDHYYDDISAPLDPQFTFDNFIVGKPNELAYAAAQRVAQSEVVSFNPLFLYGGVGLGKTHLMHAVAWNIKKRNPKKNVVYLTAEKFMYQFIKALRFKNIMSFKEQFRSVDVLMIDDVQFIIGKDNTQEEFFHTFNALLEGGKQMILTCDRYPKEIDGLEERLKSRFGWGLTVAVEPPELETRAAILIKKATQARVNLPTEAAFFIAQRIRSNVRELEGALKRVIASAHFTGSPINVDLIRESLKDLLAIQDRLVTIDNIQRVVSEYYKLKMSELLSKRRSRSIARPRQVAMALAKTLTNHSLPEIGEAFGGRDHTTVLHACRKIKELEEESLDMQDDMKHLLRALTT